MRSGSPSGERRDRRPDPEKRESSPPRETQKHYEYRFEPPIASYEQVKKLAEIVNKYVRDGEGGFAIERAVTADDVAVSSFILKVPKRLLISAVQEMFSRLNETELVKMDVTTETYTPEPVDERMLISLEPGQHLVATVQVGAGGDLVRAGWRILDSDGSETDYFPARASFIGVSTGDKTSQIDAIGIMEGLQTSMNRVFRIKRRDT